MQTVRVFGAITLLIGFVVATAIGQSSFGFGLVFGGLLMLGLLGGKVSRTFQHLSSRQRIEGRSNIEFVVMGAVSVLPMTIVGAVCLLLARGDNFFKLVAGGSFSYAFSMALLFTALRIVFGKNKSQS
jgi:hypothetical protein